MQPHMRGSLRGLRVFPALGHRRRGAHAPSVRWSSKAQGPTGRNQAKAGAGCPPDRGIPEYGALGDCTSAHHHSLPWADGLLSMLPSGQVK